MLNIPIRSSSRKKCISPIRMTNTAESLVDMPKMSFEEGDPSNLQNNEESPIVKIPVTPDSTKLQELNEKFAKKTSLNHQISESFENYSNIALMIAQKEIKTLDLAVEKIGLQNGNSDSKFNIYDVQNLP